MRSRVWFSSGHLEEVKLKAEVPVKILEPEWPHKECCQQAAQFTKTGENGLCISVAVTNKMHFHTLLLRPKD